jgi:hypothetical protein
LQPNNIKDESLNELWQQDNKVENRNETTEPKSIEKNGVIKLDEGKQISSEEFEQQKLNSTDGKK